MQMEMEAGGTKLFFDLFVAMCNHMDDLEALSSPNYGMKGTPRTIWNCVLYFGFDVSAVKLGVFGWNFLWTRLERCCVSHARILEFGKATNILGDTKLNLNLWDQQLNEKNTKKETIRVLNHSPLYAIILLHFISLNSRGNDQFGFT